MGRSGTRVVGAYAIVFLIGLAVINAWLYPFHRVRLCDGGDCIVPPLSADFTVAPSRFAPNIPNRQSLPSNRQLRPSQRRRSRQPCRNRGRRRSPHRRKPPPHSTKRRMRASIELAAKRLELLHELVPTASVVAVLGSPTNPGSEPEARSMQDAARFLGLQAHILRARTPSEIDAAFQALIELQAGALLVGGDALFTNQRTQVVALAARHAVPAIYQWREFAVAGGLMSYGTNLIDGYRLVGTYAGRILKGAEPADLPVQQAVKLDLVINLKTAETLGLTIPLTLASRADEVIE